MLNIYSSSEGHTIVGIGYDSSTNTIYLQDTWDYLTHTMTWGSSYARMTLSAVGIVNLAPSDAKTLTVIKNGTGIGTVTSNPSGINCGSNCSYAFANNIVVNLMAAPTSPSTFDNWNGAGCSGTGICTVTMKTAQFVTVTFNYQPTGNRILLVDDDNNAPDVRSYYTNTLSALGKSYDVWDTNNTDNEPGAATLAQYDTVIWFTGVEYGGYAGPGPAGESALGTWLNGGGCFLLSSQDYYYDRKLTPFASTFLGVSSVGSDMYQTTVTGTGSVFSGLGPYTLNYPFSNYSDLVSPDATAENAFNGDMGNAAVDKNGGIFRTAYLGFPFEGIASPADRQQVMGAFLNWCPSFHRIFLPLVMR